MSNFFSNLKKNFTSISSLLNDNFIKIVVKSKKCSEEIIFYYKKASHFPIIYKEAIAPTGAYFFV